MSNSKFTIKLYLRIGVATTDQGKVCAKMCNDPNREMVLTDHGWTNIKFIDLPYPMDRYHGGMYVSTLSEGEFTPDELQVISISSAMFWNRWYSMPL